MADEKNEQVAGESDIIDFNAEAVRLGDHLVRGTAADGQVRAFAITARASVQELHDRHQTSPVVSAALGRLLMAGMMMGEAMSQNMANAMNNVMNGQLMNGAVPPPIPNARYHIVINGQDAGEFDKQALSQMAIDGRINKNTLVWRQGMADWTAAGSVYELQDIFVNNVPPIP